MRRRKRINDLGVRAFGVRYLKVRDLTPQQRQLYDVLMKGRTGSLPEARADALLMIENATKQGFLEEELAYWTQ